MTVITPDDHRLRVATREIWAELRRTGHAQRNVRLDLTERLSNRVRAAARRDGWQLIIGSDRPRHASTRDRNPRRHVCVDFQLARRIGAPDADPVPPDGDYADLSQLDEAISRRAVEFRYTQAVERQELHVLFVANGYDASRHHARRAWNTQPRLARGALWSDLRDLAELAAAQDMGRLAS